MTFYRAIHADDEPSAREHLSDILQSHSDIQMEAQCSSGKQLLAALQAAPPDVLFLDIDLGDMTGFDVLQALPSVEFEVIFTTAYSEYAVTAFEVAAVDYLLKPFGAEQLARALDRLRAKRQSPSQPKATMQLLHNLQTTDVQQHQIILSTNTGAVTVVAGDIERCQSQGALSVIFTAAGQQYIVSRTMKECTQLFTSFGFLRAAQSVLVNPRYVACYNKRSQTLELKGGYKIEMSRRFASEFMKQIKPF